MLRKIKKLNLPRIAAFALCLIIIVATPLIVVKRSDGANGEKAAAQALTLWQIDSFEGGKGSRASYLQNFADKFSKEADCYINITSLTAEAARLNLDSGNSPDIISFGAGITGLEGYLNDNPPYTTWCHGGYCILSLQENCDFSDITAENTVINRGTENLIGVAALFSGLSAAEYEKPTGAYLKLLDGSYKYLLGTQRDIFRLITRGTAFSVKPVEIFNDLYQNISIISNSPQKRSIARRFIDYLLEGSNDLTKIGLMPPAGGAIYDNEMKAMEGVNYKYKLTSPVSEETKKAILSAISDNDENKLKNLLK